MYWLSGFWSRDVRFSQSHHPASEGRSSSSCPFITTSIRHQLTCPTVRGSHCDLPSRESGRTSPASAEQMP